MSASSAPARRRLDREDDARGGRFPSSPGLPPVGPEGTDPGAPASAAAGEQTSRYVRGAAPREVRTIRLVHPPGSAPSDGDPLAYLDALYRLARRLTRGSPEAEDLVQETYARAFRHGGTFSPGTNVRAWLFRVLRNAFLDARRRVARGLPVDAEADPDAAPGPDAGDGWLRGDAELEHLRGVVAEEIEAALRALPEHARTVVLLDAEGLDEGEIAVVMGCAPGTVKSRLHRARAALRTQLAEYRR